MLLSLIKVQGKSMMPALAHGDFVMASRFYRGLKRGDLIVVEHAQYHRIIKRIHDISASKGYQLAGENTASVTSEQMGWISEKQIIGKVLMTIKA